MSQVNIITREQSVRVGRESTFGVTPSGSFPNAMARFVASEPVLADGAVREMLDVNDIRVRRMDAVTPVQGLEIASKVALTQLLKATKTAAQLTTSVSAGALTPRLLLGHCMGTEFAINGSVVAAGVSTTVFDVTGTHGARFRRGTFIAVEVSGQMEWARVVSIATDTITVEPALSGTPATSAIVRNLYNYSMAESNTSSLAVQVAYVGDSAAQYTFNGVHGNLKFAFGEFGKLVSMALDGTAVSFTGPTSQSVPVTTITDEMGSAFPLAPQVYLTTSLTRGTTVACEKFAVELPNQWEMVRDPAATNTVTAVVDTAGRPRGVKAMVTLRFDGDYPTGYDADTAYSLVIVQRIGTGTTASFWLWALENVQLVAQPKLTKVGERLYMDLEFNALQGTVLAPAGGESAGELDALYTPLAVAFG
ncbi:MAG: hypothetical protein ACRCZ2_02540 [Fusobacteriaceae bacterium]